MQDENIKILVKLFETLKESSNRNEDTTQKLVMQQLELVSQIKNLPVDDLKEALKEHAKESTHNIDVCAGAIQLRSDDIMKQLRIIINKVNRMILVVGVAFTIISASYIIIRSVSDDKVIYENIKKEIEKNQQETYNKFLNEIREEMKRLHAHDRKEIAGP